MALEIADRVKETTTTMSTGTYTLAGAVDGFQSFAAVGDGNTTYYACTDGTDYEVGVGSYTASGTTLSRVTILESSNSDAAVSWGAGTKEIFVTVPAEKYLVRDASGNVSLTGNLAVSGTVDGRDVAADGTKLDGIESGATADQTAAQIRAKVEAASDSNVFTDADHAKLNGIEANAKDDQTITAGSGLTGGGTGDVTLSHADTSSQASVNGSGRTYIQDITLDTYGHVTGLATATETVVNTDTVPNNATITISAGNALTGGGNFTTDQASNETITINHQDTSSQASVNNSGRTYIQDITLDSYGHVTGISSATETVVNTDTNTTYSAGSGLSLSGTTFSHTDTSSQASVNNGGGTVIQDVTLDTYGHVTGLTSYNLDGRYYTETESDSRYMKKSGDSVLDMNNYNITNVNHLTFNDAGPNEGIEWLGGNGWKIYESPDNLTTNGAGNLQFVTGSTRRMTIQSDGDVDVEGTNFYAKNATFDNGTSTTVNVACDDGGNAHIIAGGTNQGTGIVEVRQSSSHGGGIEYNGDNSPTTTGAGADYIALFQRRSGTLYWTARNYVNDYNWEFRGEITVPNKIIHTGDTNTYMQFHAADQWRVVCGGTEQLAVNTTRSQFAGHVKLTSGHFFERSDHHTGHLVGSYNSVGANSTKSNPIYTIGSNYNPTDAAISGMYGIGYSHVNASFLPFSGGWGMYVAADGDARVWLSGSSGHVYATGDVRTAASDARLKTNVQEIPDAVEKVKAIRGVTFDWVDDIESEYDFHPMDKHDIGVIAQEVEAVLPELVDEAPFNGSYTEKTGKDHGFRTVRYDRMVALLIEAVKEQQTQIDALTAQIEELKRQ